MNPREYFDKLQAESENGFHKQLGVWTDESSSIAKFLNSMEESG